MKKTWFAAILLALGLWLGGSGSARAEAIRELVYLQNAMSLPVSGVGIVTGLSNTGDKNVAAITMIRDYLAGSDLNFELSQFTAGNIALVQVYGELKPFTRANNRFTVTVTAMNDAKSLAGGQLLHCRLFDGDGTLMGEANGQVVVGATSLNRGTILDGAQQLAENPFGNVLNKEDNSIALCLNRPNWGDANAICRQINQNPSLNPYLQETSMFAETEASRPVAYAYDAGQVIVFVPPQYRLRSELTSYIEGIMKVPVSVDRPAIIYINRAKNSIVVTGDIRVNNASVSLQDKSVTLRPETPERPAGYVLENETPRSLVELDGPGSYADLQGLIDTLNAMGLTTEQITIIFEELVGSKAIHAELVNR